MMKKVIRKRVAKVFALICAVLLAFVSMPPVKVQAANVTLTLNVTNWDGTPYSGNIMLGEVLGTIADACREITVTNGMASVSVKASYNVCVWSGSAASYNQMWLKEVNYNGYIQVLDARFGPAPSSNYSKSVTFVRPDYSTSFIITAKETITGTGIQGAVYSTIDHYGNYVTATTNASGIATFNFTYSPAILYSNYSYTFSEVSLPRGYKKSGSTFGFSFSLGLTTVNPSNHLDCGHIIEYSYAISRGGTLDNKTLSYTYDSALDVSKMYLTLEDTDTGEPIRGGKFDVSMGGTVLKTLTTNASGEAVYEGIDNGTYTIKQTATDSNYNINATQQNVTVNKNDVNVTFKNTRKTGTLNVKIADSATGAGIPNAQFILNGNGKNQTYTTNASGVMSFTGIRYGVYNLNEYDIPTGYVAKNLSVSLTLNASTAGSTSTYSYNKSADTAPPSIAFSTLPGDNSVASFTQTLTLLDNSSGIKELKIDDVSVFSAPSQGVLSTTFNHVITANKTYKYSLTDYAGNTFTTQQTVKSILYQPLQLSDPVLSNYRTTVTYGGQNTYVVNASYSYSNVIFDLSGEAGNTFSYTVELVDASGRTVQQTNKPNTATGSVTARLFYQDSVVGTAASDGVCAVKVTVGDGYNSVTKSLQVIVKRSPPPRPVITYTASAGTAAIDYPSDLFDDYTTKQYAYLDGTKTYTGPFTVTKNGTITATYTDLAGNKTTALLSVTPPRGTGEDGGAGGVNPIPTPAPGGNGDSSGDFGGKYGTASMMDETRNCWIYYINMRGTVNDPAVIQAILDLIE